MGHCNRTGGCNRTVTSANHIKCTQLNPPITEFISITNNHLPYQTGTFPKWTYFVTSESEKGMHLFSPKL